MNITFVGGGNMASALIGGLLGRARPGAAGGSTDTPRITVIDPEPAQRERLGREFGVSAVAGLAPGAAPCDVLVLAVKPQQMREALAPLAAHARQALVISVAAGIRAADLARWLGGHTRVVRTMPNTPALIGAGITGLWASPELPRADRELAQRIVNAVGESLWVEQEAMLDAVTAISGSGPAYVFFFMEAVHAAAVRLGFTDEAARQLTLATFRGAAALASNSTDPIAVLREKVTSKGGTTAAALAVMQERELAAHVGDAVAAACRRSVELADEFGRDPG
ncbi:MAG TPA: pyrroline-5-carboxylate reductase [Burkholderiaceae bacterium]|jgi:pyrroline-5-carboxylate reductase|nr:pyrroline-5-carboxylate reductase [Burkholderiaceae bacterium]